jgi:stage V sporulation protein G
VKITEVRVKLLEGRTDRLRAFCSITLDNEFVVHDLRVIDGRKGLFVAMPSRKLTDSCFRCNGKNHLKARFCSECGARLDENRASKGSKVRD